ncbi:CBS-domain-containing protein [Mucidula mucida]|nr:CBS-domain-containing protein [Mucidula mucida]
MSRIPVPSHSPQQRNLGPSSPVPFPNSDRASSPLPSRPSHSTSGSASMSSLSGFQSETRKKQSKRDEAIRKKIESELSRKRTISTTQQRGSGRRSTKQSAQKGTVAALKPTPALTVPENITVAEASQLCAAKRTDCVLVVDDDEGLSGIFTAKDLAYRVTAEGLDPHLTPVHQIMTKNPMVTQSTTSATEALQLMVARHFRHLPVCNEDGNVVGLLDITKVFHEALGKVERSSAASEQLFSAMAGVQSELGSVSSNPQAVAMLAWAERLREKTALPDLTTVMDSRTQPAMVGPKATVREVAKLMKERRTTAVCVMEHTQGVNAPPKIAGIFTSKDVVLRVIAAGLDAGRCSVVRVMTPHPDTAPPTLIIHDALKKMHTGHYLNLPVVEADGRLVAIVDVLKLTYATLEQMNVMTGGDPSATDAEGGPMWSRFFDSFDDTESAISGSQFHESRTGPSLTSLSRLQHSPQSEVHPNDSASVIDDEPISALEGYPRQRGGALPSVAAPLPADDGTYVFKFRTPSGRTHRFQARHDDVEHLREVVAGKLATDPFFTDFKGEDGDMRPDPIDFQLLYTDEDGDTVLITSDHDVTDAVKIARAAHSDRVVLFVQGGKGWKETESAESEVKAAEPAAAVHQEYRG